MAFYASTRGYFVTFLWILRASGGPLLLQAEAWPELNLTPAS